MAIAEAELAGIETVGLSREGVDVVPFGEQDRACVTEILEVIERHGLSGRFTLGLAHEHFGNAGDEVLVETVDEQRRTLTSEPEKIAEVARISGGVVTSFILYPDASFPPQITDAHNYCLPHVDANGSKTHLRITGPQ